MWIMLNDAFISVVAAQADSLRRAGIEDDPRDWLSVRARKAGHIERVFPKATVMSWPGRDYAFRAFVPRWRVMEVIALRVQGIDYPNFKDSVRDRGLHDAYLDVWSVMWAYQQEQDQDEQVVF